MRETTRHSRWQATGGFLDNLERGRLDPGSDFLLPLFPMEPLDSPPQDPAWERHTMTILLQISFITSSILSPPLPYIGERKRVGCPKSKPIILRGFGPLLGLESVPQVLGRAQNTENPPTRTHDNKRSMRRENSPGGSRQAVYLKARSWTSTLVLRRGNTRVPSGSTRAVA